MLVFAVAGCLALAVNPKFNLFKTKRKGYLPLTEMSTSDVESMGQNLIT
jgi:hypothetical protein